MSAPAIVLNGVTRRFGTCDVLERVSLTVEPGEAVALVGRNGSGKTTLLEILSTLLEPTAGVASVHGHDVVRDAASVRRLVGYCSSNLQSFYPRLTGRRNLLFFAALYQVEAARARVEQLLDHVGLADAADTRVERYSDGMKARLALARSLLSDAPVLLLDEPTKSLDASGREVARTLALGARPGGEPRTVVWVTHDWEEARAVSSRVCQLEDGHIREMQAAS